MSCRIHRLSALALALVLLEPVAAADQTRIEGVWLNEDGDGWIELSIVDGELTGIIAGSPDDPLNERPSRLDEKNPDPAHRSRPLLGLTILQGFRYEGDDRWAGGRIYDPNSGKTYRGTITVVDDDTLDLRGYVGISLLGRTETWRRRQ
jgi:uncharacterized protein (DUF2147 family)